MYWNHSRCTRRPARYSHRKDCTLAAYAQWAVDANTYGPGRHNMYYLTNANSEGASSTALNQLEAGILCGVAFSVGAMRRAGDLYSFGAGSKNPLCIYGSPQSPWQKIACGFALEVSLQYDTSSKHQQPTVACCNDMPAQVHKTPTNE